MIREDFLQQSAYSDLDSFCPVEKQYLMLKVIMEYYENANTAMGRGVSLRQIQALPLKAVIGRMKEIQETKELESVLGDIREKMSALEVER
jgi:V/A-type H+-transporting ATPase subunit A